VRKLWGCRLRIIAASCPCDVLTVSLGSAFMAVG
jgi:hypothetical protein